ncbi:MAG: hypothetical protein FJ265_15030, partial [Planctomycetes bacterium]|nr:hypothetical protein [Planctomycetota bacterium]
MREGPRRLLMRLLWGALLVAASVYAGLRIGRPVYYTDGQRVVAGADLAGAGMVEWPTPEVVAELPGPVQGRVARLRDGRLLYGRSLPGGSTDLVLFDPARPAVPPEPAFALNSPHHELAPAVGADGRIWFASDRPGGAGGYDLYVARSTGAGFGAPEPVAAANSPLDECDPAPAPDGSALVFVRIEAQRAAGDGGVLLTWRPGGTDPPRPLFEEPAPRRRGAGAVDRDPAFAADGGALWFVRRQQRGGLSLLRASCCNGEFAAPEVVGAGWGVADLRAPSPSGDGFELGLLQARSGDGDASLWFRSRAREVYPWWPGQRWLEWLLLGFAGTCLLLLVLLHLGRRWRALDLLAQCLLVSLLLHVLLLLWLMGVEITGALLRGRDDGGGLRVELVAQADAGTAGTAGQRLVDLAAEVRFDPAVRELAAAAPEVALERPAEAAPQAPEGNREAQHGPSAVTATAVLLDAAAAADPLRAGSDAPAAIAARELAAMAAPAAAAARPAAAPASSSQQAVVVVLPGVSLAAGAEVAAPLPGPPVAGAAFPAARAAPVAAAELRDRAAADAAVQRGEAAAQGVVPFAAAAAQIVAVAPAGTAAAVREPAPAEALEGSGRAPTAPATALAGAGHELVPPLPTRAPAPQPARRSGAAAVALRDPAPAAAVGAPAAADAAVTIARSPQRIALAAPAPVAAAVAAARTLPAADPARAAPPAGPVPGAALARADEPPAAAAGDVGLAMPRSGRQPARRPPALRDGGRALAAEVGAGVAAAGREAEVQPVATGA